MAIRDVVTRGWGNGTYDPGVTDIPTRGYSIGAVAVSLPGCVILGKVANPVPYARVADPVPAAKVADPVPLGKVECN